jgi:hypothetical protein
LLCLSQLISHKQPNTNFTKRAYLQSHAKTSAQGKAPAEVLFQLWLRELPCVSLFALEN